MVRRAMGAVNGGHTWLTSPHIAEDLDVARDLFLGSIDAGLLEVLDENHVVRRLVELALDAELVVAKEEGVGVVGALVKPEERVAGTFCGAALLGFSSRGPLQLLRIALGLSEPVGLWRRICL